MSTSIDIDNDFMTLKEIKAQFNNKFPNLMIEFFMKSHEEGQASPKTAIYDDAFRLKDIRLEGSMKPISIHGNTKTSSFRARALLLPCQRRTCAQQYDHYFRQ